MNIVTACSSDYWPRLTVLMGSINAHYPDANVYVCPLNLNEEEVACVKRNAILKPLVNNPPFLLERLRRHEYMPESSCVGLFAWKPFLIHQMLQELPGGFWWFDAGNIICKHFPELQAHAERQGYFGIGVHDVGWETTAYVKKTLNVTEEEMGGTSINAGIVYVSDKVAGFVEDCYKCCFDERLFVDDGTARGGKTAGRHDQTILAIHWNRHNLTIDDPKKWGIGFGPPYSTCVLNQARGDGPPRYRNYLK